MSTVENSETTDPVETPDLANKWLKLRIAEMARLMGDNQRVIDGNNAQLEQDRDFERRLTEAIAKERFSDWQSPQDGQAPGSDEMKIAIDSPTTINYTSQPTQTATQQTPAGIGKSALLAAALAAAGLGGVAGAGIPWMLGAFDEPEAAAFTDTDTDTNTEYRLEIEGSQ